MLLTCRSSKKAASDKQHHSTPCKWTLFLCENFVAFFIRQATRSMQKKRKYGKISCQLRKTSIRVGMRVSIYVPPMPQMHAYRKCMYIHISLFACNLCHHIFCVYVCARDISHDGWKINESQKYVSNSDEEKRQSRIRKVKSSVRTKWRRAKSYLFNINLGNSITLGIFKRLTLSHFESNTIQ